MVSTVASLCGVCMFPVFAWAIHRYSSFVPLSKDMHVRLFSDPKLSIGVNTYVLSVPVCQSCNRLVTCLGCSLPLTQ